MKISVLILKSMAILGLLLSAGCANHRPVPESVSVSVPDPAYAPPVEQVTPMEPAVAINPPPVLRVPPATNEPTGPSRPIVVMDPPPPPQVEIVRTSPGPEYVWIPGFWQWHGRWSWVSGRWAISPHPNALWVPGHWDKRASGGWIWIRGYWR